MIGHGFDEVLRLVHHPLYCPVNQQIIHRFFHIIVRHGRFRIIREGCIHDKMRANLLLFLKAAMISVKPHPC